MNVLYIGDIMGEAGIEVVESCLGRLKAEHKVDMTIAQAENVSAGRGITQIDYQRLRAAGINCFTGGNWTLYRDETHPLLESVSEPIVRPANYPLGTPGLEFKYVSNVLVVSLLGKIVGKDADVKLDNPLKKIDLILESQEQVEKSGIIVNFHGDFSSEKVVIGHYLDGRASLVVGDHWHVPTADARLLPNGTAHITDVGMCGSLDSSLGVTYESVIPRWRDGVQTRNQLETAGLRQFNAVVVNVDENGLARSIKQIRLTDV
jgi:metallophosphoesterase (TIGR00282 family)